MPDRYVDLHLHTNHSDGTDSPARVVERAAELGFSAIAVCDHDTVSGVAEAQAAAEARAIEFFPAAEISSSFNDAEVHIVGLGIDVANEPLRDALDRLASGRNNRADLIIQRLHELGVPVDRDRIAARTADGLIGRMHIAQEIHELGFSATVQDAFDRYIGRGRRAFVRKPTISVERAIALIQQARGLAILAHPGIGSTYRMLNRLLRLPFDGIEAWHCKHSPGMVDEFLTLAAERNLLVSGGSDCHGQAKRKPEMGNVRVPYERFEQLREAVARRQGD